MVRIKLSGGDELMVDWTLGQTSDMIKDALKHDALLEIEQNDGTVVVVNPRQIQFASEVAPNGVGTAAAPSEPHVPAASR